MIQLLIIRIFDILFSLIFIICLIPVFLVISIVISIKIDFPPFYSSRRIGKNGTQFTHIKFKSMLPGEETGRVFFEQHRLTPLGKFLRHYHIDEIPEFLLILTGKMSLVGPRPLPAKHLTEYDINKRHNRKPGYTGTAQIYLLKNGFLPKKVQNRLDCILVSNLTVKRYFKIILTTFLYNFKSAKINMDESLTDERRNYLKQKN